MIVSTSSAWPLPSTPAMPRTSPAWIVKEMSSSSVAAFGAASVTPSTVSDRDSVTVDSAVSGDGQLAADHQLGQLRAVTCGAGRWPTVVPRPDDGDLVGDRQHLVQLVGDEDDGQAPRLQLAQRGEQLVDLLRHEHRRRLVEDQDAGAAVEHLEDLDPLPVADAEVVDERVGVDVEAVRRPSSLMLARAPRDVEPSRPWSGSSPSTTFSSTVRLSASMKCWCTMPTPRAIASRGV